MPPHTPHTFLYNTIIVKYKQVYSHVNSPHIFTAADMLLAHIRTAVLFYLHRRHGWITPASVYSWSALACYLLISGLWCYSTYIVDTAGLHQPPYIRNPHLRATCSYPDIRQIKNQRQASLPLIFYFPHCLRLHHAHSGAGTGWHCWSVLFDCSYC